MLNIKKLIKSAPGDLRMWVYLDTRSSGNCVCVVVHPNMTAAEMTDCVLREARCLSYQNLQMFCNYKYL
jgi:hypothetical protein